MVDLLLRGRVAFHCRIKQPSTACYLLLTDVAAVCNENLQHLRLLERNEANVKLWFMLFKFVYLGVRFVKVVPRDFPLPSSLLAVCSRWYVPVEACCSVSSEE
jgi:hypothetical protein